AYEAESFSISGGTSGGGGNPWSGGVSPGLGVSQDESIGSTTRSGISAGTIEIRDGDESALANLDRSVTELQQDGLRDIFDLQRVQERMEMGKVAGEVGFQAAGDLAGRMGWEEGSPERAALHGLVGAGMAALGGGNALQGATGAAASQLATNAMQDYLRDNDIDPNSPEGRSLMELGSLAVGAAIGGSSGAATALHGEQFNRQLHPDEINLIGELAEEFARALCGCDEVTLAQIQEAQARLMREAAAQVDAVANVHFGTDVDEAAQFFLQSNRQSYGWGTAFHADDAEYNSRGVFSNESSADVAASTQMYNAIDRSGVDVDTLRYMHQPQLLAWADNEVARDSRILLFGQGATALAGAGLVLAPTVLGTLTTQSAINAGRVQEANNVPTLTASAMATSAGTGAAVGG